MLAPMSHVLLCLFFVGCFVFFLVVLLFCGLLCFFVEAEQACHGADAGDFDTQWSSERASQHHEVPGGFGASPGAPPCAACCARAWYHMATYALYPPSVHIKSVLARW